MYLKGNVQIVFILINLVITSQETICRLGIVHFDPGCFLNVGPDQTPCLCTGFHRTTHLEVFNIRHQELLQLLEVLAKRSASVEDTAIELLEDGVIEW